MGDLKIGTSGWSYDDWTGDFYPPGTGKGDMLQHYVEQFNSAEINATFYRMPFENMVRGWKEKAPPGFSYSVKGARKITHYNKLKNTDGYLGDFLDRVMNLESALGSVFWQLPPGFEKDAARLENFLEKLPPQNRYAVEFRDTSWLDEEIYGILENHDTAPVWVSSGKMPDDCRVTSDFIYIRFHGLTGYRYEYERDELEPWADLIAGHLEEGLDARVYFNNTGGNAPECAKWLDEMLEEFSTE